MSSIATFVNPPIAEVVCGVYFRPVVELKVAHFGTYWADIKSDFPNVQDMPPLPIPASGGVQTFEFLTIPPLPRVWFEGGDNNHLIQIQREAFIFNWRQGETEGEQNRGYPTFDSIYPEFKKRFNDFVKFLELNDLGDVEITSFELTYVNHIDSDLLKKFGFSLTDILVDHRPAPAKGRDIPDPSSYQWATSYHLPNEIGVLHITANTARKKDNDTPIIRLTISVKGSPGSSNPKMEDWFKLAHQWVVNGFLDITNKDIQDKVWGRTK